MMFDRRNGSDCARLAGALRYARECDHWDIRTLTVPSKNIRADINYYLGTWKADGVIHGLSLPSSGQISRLWRNGKVRAASVDCIIQSANTPDIRVAIDDSAIGTSAAELLLRRKLRHFAYFLDLPPRFPSATSQQRHSDEREKAFRKEIEKRPGSTFSSLHIRRGNSTWTDDLGKISRWLETLPFPCGIMAYNDECADVLLQACHASDVSVPGQVNVISVDNDVYICNTSKPTLSSILPDFEEAGYIAARALDRILRFPSRPHPPLLTYGIKSVCERQSTQDLHGAARIVSDANDIIRDKATTGISANEVARLLNISPRLLEMRFREIKKRTVRDELIRLRLEAVANLLKTTRESIGDICFGNGFKTLANAQMLFKRKYGKSMSAYRQS